MAVSVQHHAQATLVPRRQPVAMKSSGAIARLIALEDFITFSRRGSFKSYKEPGYRLDKSLGVPRASLDAVANRTLPPSVKNQTPALKPLGSH